MQCSNHMCVFSANNNMIAYANANVLDRSVFNR